MLARATTNKATRMQKGDRWLNLTTKVLVWRYYFLMKMLVIGHLELNRMSHNRLLKQNILQQLYLNTRH